MTQDKSTPMPRHCPRCGGLMHKPAGSSFYWHADNNHPRCDITNVVDTAMILQTPDELPSQPPKGKGSKNKQGA